MRASGGAGGRDFERGAAERVGAPRRREPEGTPRGRAEARVGATSSEAQPSEWERRADASPKEHHEGERRRGWARLRARRSRASGSAAPTRARRNTMRRAAYILALASAWACTWPQAAPAGDTATIELAAAVPPGVTCLAVTLTDGSAVARTRAAALPPT